METKETTRFSIDFTLGQGDKLTRLSTLLGISKGEVIKRLLDAATIPDRANGQRLCVCNGDRKVSDIAGI